MSNSILSPMDRAAAEATTVAAAHCGHWQHAPFALIADALQRIAAVIEAEAAE